MIQLNPFTTLLIQVYPILQPARALANRSVKAYHIKDFQNGT